VWKSEKEGVWKSERQEGEVRRAATHRQGCGARPILLPPPWRLSSTERVSERETGGEEGVFSVCSRECDGAGGQAERSMTTGYASDTPGADRVEPVRYASDSQEEVRVRYATRNPEGELVRYASCAPEGKMVRHATCTPDAELLRYASDSQEEVRVRHPAGAPEAELVRYATELRQDQEPVKPMGPPRSLAHRRWGSGVPLSPSPAPAPGPSFLPGGERAGAPLGSGKELQGSRGYAGARPLWRGHQSLRERGSGRGMGEEEGAGGLEAEHSGSKLRTSPGIEEESPAPFGAAGAAARGVPGGERRKGLPSTEARQAPPGGSGALRKAPRGAAGEQPKLGARMALYGLAFEYYAQDGRSPGGK